LGLIATFRPSIDAGLDELKGPFLEGLDILGLEISELDLAETPHRLLAEPLGVFLGFSEDRQDDPSEH
jgi:hypothetical protein